MSPVASRSFWVRGIPKPQPRPRACSVGGKARVHNPTSADGWRQLVALAATDMQPEGFRVDETGGEPVGVFLRFLLPRPLSDYGTGRNAGQLRPGVVGRPHTGTPDVDNLAKAVLDALAGIAYADDGQVTELVVLKRYVDVDEDAGCEIRIATAV